MNSSGGPPSYFSRTTIAVLLISVIAIYFLYGFLFSSATLSPTVLVGDEITAPPTGLKGTDIPQPYEGGDYSFNTWVYVNNFRDNLNARKPIFELQGSEFSTLFVGLGANSNTLVVRTHSKGGSSVEGFADTGSQGAASGSNGPSSAVDGSLKRSDRPAFLNGADAMTTGSEPICDLPSVDLQRWVMVTVVLSGRTIDVYMDGKLTRSCVTKSYYKVDPKGVVPVILGGAANTSYSVAGLSVARFALYPGEIYRIYSSGPKSSQTFTSWLISLVSGT